MFIDTERHFFVENPENSSQWLPVELLGNGSINVFNPINKSDLTAIETSNQSEKEKLFSDENLNDFFCFISFLKDSIFRGIINNLHKKNTRQYNNTSRFSAELDRGGWKKSIDGKTLQLNEDKVRPVKRNGQVALDEVKPIFSWKNPLSQQEKTKQTVVSPGASDTIQKNSVSIGSLKFNDKKTENGKSHIKQKKKVRFDSTTKTYDGKPSKKVAAAFNESLIITNQSNTMKHPPKKPSLNTILKRQDELKQRINQYKIIAKQYEVLGKQSHAPLRQVYLNKEIEILKNILEEESKLNALKGDDKQIEPAYKSSRQQVLEQRVEEYRKIAKEYQKLGNGTRDPMQKQHYLKKEIESLKNKAEEARKLNELKQNYTESTEVRFSSKLSI